MFFYGCDNGEEQLISHDAAEAAWLFKAAARKGNAVGQHMLGLLYLGGTGSALEIDYAASLKYCRLAARQGYVPAMRRMGKMYRVELSYFVERDTVEAERWFRLAAEAGDAESQWELFLLYCAGDGVPQDKAEAYAWGCLSVYGHGAFAAHVNEAELAKLGEALPEAVRAKARAIAER